MFRIVSPPIRVSVQELQGPRSQVFPFHQPMKIYSSVRNADDEKLWATESVSTSTAARRRRRPSCAPLRGTRLWDQKRELQDLDAMQYRRLSWVRQKYTIYNYCAYPSRYPTIPTEFFASPHEQALVNGYRAYSKIYIYIYI